MLAASCAELAHAGLRRQLVLVAVLAQEPEQAVQLRDGLPARRLDRGQRLLRLGLIAVDHEARGARLDAHHAHVVRDDVVQLARDPHALLEHRPPRVLLALALGLQRRAPRPTRPARSARAGAKPASHAIANSPGVTRNSPAAWFGSL